jgi:hypothetical protein
MKRVASGQAAYYPLGDRFSPHPPLLNGYVLFAHGKKMAHTIKSENYSQLELPLVLRQANNYLFEIIICSSALVLSKLEDKN